MVVSDYKREAGSTLNKDFREVMISPVNSGPPSTMMNFFND